MQRNEKKTQHMLVEILILCKKDKMIYSACYESHSSFKTKCILQKNFYFVEIRSCDDYFLEKMELTYCARLVQCQNQRTNSAWVDFNDASPLVVIDDFLYYGDINHANNIKLLKNLGIKHIVNSCNEQLKIEILENFNVLWINIMDFPEVDINQHFQ